MSFLAKFFGVSKPYQPKTVSSIVQGIQTQIDELKSLETLKQQEVAACADEMQKLVQKQDEANTEAFAASNVAASLETLINQPKQITLAELKKEMN